MIFKSQPRQENPVSVLTALIRQLKVPVTSATIKTGLTEHPNYPSLLAISDCLTTWKVHNEAFKIDKKGFNLSELSSPFIAHFTTPASRFILVHEIQNGTIRYSNEEKSNAILAESEFLNRWDGIILYAEKNDHSGESNYENALIKEWLNRASLPFLVLIILICILNAINYTNLNLLNLVSFVLKIIGIVVSSLLLMHSIDAQNPFLQNLCSLGKKNNCNTILKSDAAKITPWLSWSEVGMFYFSGSSLCLLLVPGTTNLLAWLNVACLPYTVYSIGYQIKNKNWCILCCTIQLLLWLEAITFSINPGFDYQIGKLNIIDSHILSILLCFLFPVAIWMFLKSVFIKSVQTKSLKQQLKRFKYNTDLFNQALTNQPYHHLSDEIMPIVLGNPNAETVITMVSNLFCGPCGKTHQTLEEWLKERDDIQLKIVFITGRYDEDSRGLITKHMTSLSLLADKEIVANALHSWYALSTKNYESWAPKYPVKISGEIDNVDERQKSWCDKAEITFTPTLFINGYKLPEPYGLEDVKYLIN